MTAAGDMAALPGALRRLAAALDDVLSLAGLADTRRLAPATVPAWAPPKLGRRCAWCREPIPADMRRDAACCSDYCRKNRWRALQRTGTAILPARPAGNAAGNSTGNGAVADAEQVVAALWPPAAVTLMRDVEPRQSRAGDVRYRGRVRWADPATGRRHGHSRTFTSQTQAWAWVRTWTAPQPAGDIPEGGRL